MSNLPLNIEDRELQPFTSVGRYSLLANVRKSPTVLYGIFVELLRQFYSNSNNYGFGVPLKIWKPSNDETEIWIDTELRWEDERPEKRPAIYVKLGEISYASLTGRKDGLMGGDCDNSVHSYSRNATGSVSFVHIAGTAGEACVLGDATLDYLDAFGSVIRDDFGMQSFFLSGRIPKMQMPKESKDMFGSQVTFGFEIQDCWTLKLEAQRLKVLTLRAGQRLLDSGIVR